MIKKKIQIVSEKLILGVLRKILTVTYNLSKIYNISP